jgi:hypothetical protein
METKVDVRMVLSLKLPACAPVRRSIGEDKIGGEKLGCGSDAEPSLGCCRRNNLLEKPGAARVFRLANPKFE